MWAVFFPQAVAAVYVNYKEKQPPRLPRLWAQALASDTHPVPILLPVLLKARCSSQSRLAM